MFYQAAIYVTSPTYSLAWLEDWSQSVLIV